MQQILFNYPQILLAWHKKENQKDLNEKNRN